MKKIAIVLVFCLLFAASACVQTQTDPSQVTKPQNADEEYTFSLPPGEDVFYGMIVANMGNTLLVTKNETDGKTSGIYTLSSQYLDSKQDASLLVPGTYFKLYYGGFIMESYPMQFGNPHVFTCENTKADIVTPLTEFVLEKIPSDATWIALDLTGVEGLSDGESEAVFYLLECNKTVACDVVRFDPSALTTEELLNNENTPAGGAVLKVEAHLQNEKLVGSWRLTDNENVREGTTELLIPYYLN